MLAHMRTNVRTNMILRPCMRSMSRIPTPEELAHIRMDCLNLRNSLIDIKKQQDKAKVNMESILSQIQVQDAINKNITKELAHLKTEQENAENRPAMIILFIISFSAAVTILVPLIH